jgi:dipeptidyl aminopeptidase/acylaminoacyl peptidase
VLLVSDVGLWICMDGPEVHEPHRQGAVRGLALAAFAAVLLVVGTGVLGDPAGAVAPASTTRVSAETSIAVGRFRGGIALIDARGRRVATLTNHAGWEDFDPAWSPDGTRLAFARTNNDYRSFQVLVMRVDGTGVRRITSGRFDSRPAWSPDGRWIVYQATDGLRLVQLATGNSRHVPGTGKGGAVSTPFASYPGWTPDGLLTYAFHAEEKSEWPASCAKPSGHCGWVVTSRLDGSHRRPVVQGRDAHWSPDGRLILYTLPDGGVATIPAAGGRSRFLGKGFEADWSPDGRQIVFARRGDATTGDSIWIMNRDGSGRHRIMARAAAPAWRPR